MSARFFKKLKKEKKGLVAMALTIFLIVLGSPTYAYTYNQTLGTLTTGTGSVQTTMYFLNITTNTTFILENITKNATSTSARFYIFNGTSGALINSWAFNGVNASPEYTMTANNRYMLVVSNYSGAGTTHHYSNSASYSYFAKYFNMSSGGYSTSGGPPFVVEATRWYEFYNITYRDLPLPTAQVNLTVNGGSGNLSATYGASATFNYTAWNNVTGAWVSIDRNNTLMSNGTTSTTYNENLGGGLYNITSYFNSNATYQGSRATIWVTITPKTPSINITFNTTPATNNTTCTNTPILITCNADTTVTLYNETTNLSNPYVFETSIVGVQTMTCNNSASQNYSSTSTTRDIEVLDCTPSPTPTPLPSPTSLPNSTYNISSECCPIYTTYCFDNQTLAQKWNTSQGISYAFQDCSEGCDSVTNACKPPFYQTALIFLVIVIIILYVLYRIGRWL